MIDENIPKIIWDCGCVTFTSYDGKIFFIKPCSPNCDVFIISLDESKKRGNLVEIIKTKELIN